MSLSVSRVLGLAALLVLSGVSNADDAAMPSQSGVVQDIPVWQPKGGEVIRFDVRRNRWDFGHHIVKFEKTSDGRLTVVNDIDLTAKIGPITAYKYRHDSTETWENGKLLSLTGKTLKEGDKIKVDARREGDEIKVEGTNYDGAYPGDIIPSSHWNIGEIFSSGMLSSEGGQILPINLERVGEEEIEVGDETIMATKFLIRSDMDFHMWYDRQGRWVKLALESRGQKVVYRLEALY